MSITWITPFDAPTSTAVTRASLMRTAPPDTLTRTGEPSTVVALVRRTTCCDVTRPGTT